MTFNELKNKFEQSKTKYYVSADAHANTLIYRKYGDIYEIAFVILRKNDVNNDNDKEILRTFDKRYKIPKKLRDDVIEYMNTSTLQKFSNEQLNCFDLSKSHSMTDYVLNYHIKTSDYNYEL